ncbi:MAG: right-handed parallel beta-helix repeat-containing protein [Deltaproteobacteria bacterium]|nr:right-handed parallel beta-helix repeat-containing protein [Deltaproteobacteria bacterium]
MIKPRFFSILAVISLAGCSTEEPAPPAITALVPPEATAGEDVLLTIEGTGFAAAVSVVYGDSDQSAVDRRAKVSLGGGDQIGKLELEGRIVDAETIEVTVPNGAEPGAYSVVIRDALDRRAVSPVPFNLLPPPDKRRLELVMPRALGFPGECVVFTAALRGTSVEPPPPEIAIATRPDARSFDAACAAPTASAALGADGQATFAVLSPDAGPIEITVSAAGVDSIQHTLRVVSVDLAVKGPPLVAKDECTGGFEVALIDPQSGQIVPGEIPVNLDSDTQEVDFFTNQACSGRAAQAIVLRSGREQLWIRAKKGTHELRVQAGVMLGTLLIKSGASLALLDLDADLAVGECSGAATIELRDPSNQAFGAPATLSIDLSASATISFYADPRCEQPVTAVDLVEGDTTTRFHFASRGVIGTVRISAAHPALETATAQVTFSDQGVEILVPPVMAQGVPSQIELRPLGRAPAGLAAECQLLIDGLPDLVDRSSTVGPVGPFRWITVDRLGEGMRLSCRTGNGAVRGRSQPFAVRTCDGIPPSADFAPSTPVAQVGQSVTLAAPLDASYGYQYRWDLEGNGRLTPASPSWTIDHRYSRPGAYAPVLEIRDDQGCPAYAGGLLVATSTRTRVVDCAEPQSSCTLSLRQAIALSNATQDGVTTVITFAEGVHDLALAMPLQIQRPVALIADHEVIISGTAESLLTFAPGAAGSLVAGLTFEPSETAIAIESSSDVQIRDCAFRGLNGNTTGTGVSADGDVTLGPDNRFEDLSTGLVHGGGPAEIFGNVFLNNQVGLDQQGGSALVAGNLFVAQGEAAIESSPAAAILLNVLHNTFHQNGAGIRSPLVLNNVSFNIFSNENDGSSAGNVMLELPSLSGGGNQFYGQGRTCVGLVLPICNTRIAELPYLDPQSLDFRLSRFAAAIDQAAASNGRWAYLGALRQIPSSEAFDVGAFESPYILP